MFSRYNNRVLGQLHAPVFNQLISNQFLTSIFRQSKPVTIQLLRLTSPVFTRLFQLDESVFRQVNQTSEYIAG